MNTEPIINWRLQNDQNPNISHFCIFDEFFIGEFSNAEEIKIVNKV